MLQNRPMAIKSDACYVGSRRVGGTMKPRQAKRGINVVKKLEVRDASAKL